MERNLKAFQFPLQGAHGLLGAREISLIGKSLQLLGHRDGLAGKEIPRRALDGVSYSRQFLSIIPA